MAKRPPQWELVVTALLLSLAIVYHGRAGRYVPLGEVTVLDTRTGAVCGLLEAQNGPVCSDSARPARRAR